MLNIFRRGDYRLKPDIVCVGDVIRVNVREAKDGIAYVKCLGNDPARGKMLVEITWVYDGGESDELRLLSYRGKSLKDFHVLNAEFYSLPEDDSVLRTLREMQRKHEISEDYETAAMYKAALEKLTIKNK